METEPGGKKHLFTNKQLWALLVPVVVEQILNSLMLWICQIVLEEWK